MGEGARLKRQVRQALAPELTDWLLGTALQPLERLLRDPDLARRMGEAGRSTREGRFTWPRVVRRVESVYETLPAGVRQRQPE